MTAKFTVKTATQIRDDFLRTYRNGLILQCGIDNPNVSPGSDAYVEGTAIGNEIAVAMANVQLKADELMPDTATGEGLDRAVASFGMTPRRAAAGSTGFVILSASDGVTLVTGDQLIDGQGLRFEAVTGDVYYDGDEIEVQAVDTGSETNHEAGDVLRWVSTPAFSDATVTVATGGLSGGAPEEDDETLRARLQAHVSNPPGNENWVEIAQIAEASSTKVEKAFVYPAIKGGATYGLACTAYATATSKSRELSATLVSSVLEPYVDGSVTEHVEGIITTVVDSPTDIAIGLTLPESPLASPAGPGGGWVNGTPWPAVDNSTVFYASVSSATSSTSFSVNAIDGTPPTPGVTRICWLAWNEAYSNAWTLYTATVLTVGGSSTPYAITIDKPFPNIATGDFIFPASVNVQVYVDTLLAQIAKMGPGEKTNNPNISARGYRRPLPATSWPYALNATQLRAISNSGEEVQDIAYLYRSQSSPGLPSTVDDAPKIITPKRIGFYRLP